MAKWGRKLYILACQDLSLAQRMVQACHALAALILAHAEDQELHQWGIEAQRLVILAVPNEDELDLWERRLKGLGIKCEHFREPDLGEKKTALAVHPQVDERIFRSLPLLG